MYVDTKGLCFQLLQSLKDLVPMDELQAWIGRLGQLPPNDFLPLASEISILANGILAQTSGHLLQYPFHHLRHEVHECEDYVPGISISLYRNNRRIQFKEPVLKRVSELNPADYRTRRICAGISRLKSAVISDKNPSNAELEESKFDIIHSSSVDYRIRPIFDRFKDVIFDRLIESLSYLPEREYSPMVFEPANTNKCSMFINDQLELGSQDRSTLAPYNINQFIRSNAICDLYMSHKSEFISTIVVGELRTGAGFLQDPQPLGYDLPIGMIKPLPKSGGKHRWVAMPHILLNAGCYPAGRILKWINHQWSVQAVDDQLSGVEWLRRTISRHQTMKREPRFFSFDMKSWTDYFPYEEWQRRVLLELVNRRILRQFDLDIQDVCCRGKWIFPTGDHIRYGTGTPQGTKLSFPLGSFSHGFMLAVSYMLSHEGKTIDPQKLPGRIVGDDIVITDSPTAVAYEELAGYLGMIISKDKSIVSPCYAEFCSCAIDANGYDLKPQVTYPDTLSKVVNYVSNYRTMEPIDESLRRLHSLALLILEPFGLRSEVEFDLKEPLDVIFMALKVASRLKDFEDRFPTGTHISIVHERQSIFPAFQTGYTLSKPGDNYQPADTVSILERSMLRESDFLTKKMIDSRCSIMDSMTYALRVLELQKAIDSLRLFPSTKKPNAETQQNVEIPFKGVKRDPLADINIDIDVVHRILKKIPIANPKEKETKHVNPRPEPKATLRQG